MKWVKLVSQLPKSKSTKGNGSSNLGSPDENGLRIVEQRRAPKNREHGVGSLEELGEVSLVLDITCKVKREMASESTTPVSRSMVGGVAGVAGVGWRS